MDGANPAGRCCLSMPLSVPRFVSRDSNGVMLIYALLLLQLTPRNERGRKR